MSVTITVTAPSLGKALYDLRTSALLTPAAPGAPETPTGVNPLHGLSRDAVVILTHVGASKKARGFAEMYSHVWIELSDQSARLRKNPVGPVAQGSLEEVMRYVSEALAQSAPPSGGSRPDGPDTDAGSSVESVPNEVPGTCGDADTTAADVQPQPEGRGGDAAVGA